MNIPKQFNFAQHEEARKISFRPVPKGQHKHAKHNAHLKTIRDYLAHCRWGFLPDGAPGIAWLELLAGYEAHGYQLELEPNEDDEPKRPGPLKLSTKANLDLFKALVL